MKLYNLIPSPYASRCRMQIYAKDLDVEIVDIAWPPDDDYKRRTVTGRVPVLEVEGTFLPESKVIAEFFEDLGKGPSLRPSSPLERAQMRLLMQLTDNCVMPPIPHLVGQFLTGGRDQSIIGPALAELEAGLKVVHAYFRGGRYAVGSSLSLADCTLTPMLFQAELFGRHFGIEEPLRDVPRLQRYYDAIRTEPAAAKVLKEMADFIAANH